MSEAHYATAVQALMSCISTTDNLIRKAALPQNYSKAKTTLAELQTTIDSLTELTTKCRNNTKFRMQSKPARYLLNSIRSLFDALNNREINLDKFCLLLQTAVADRLNDLRDSASGHIKRVEEDPDLLMEIYTEDELSQATFVENYKRLNKSTVEPEYEEIADFSQAQYEYVNGKLVEYSRLVDKSLVGKIKTNEFSREAIIPTQCPITVNFENVALRSTKLLRHVFTGVDALGLADKDSADVALILPDQILLQFSRISAELVVAKQHDESSGAKKIEGLKLDIKQQKLSLRKMQSSLRRNRELFESAKRTQTLTTELKKKLTSEFDSQTKSIEIQERLVATLMRRRTDAKSIYNAKTRSLGKKTSNIYQQRVDSFLEDLRERGEEYSLMSNDFVTSPKNSDIALAWIVRTSVYKNLYAQTKGNTKVLSWGLPISKGIQHGKQATRSKKSRRL